MDKRTINETRQVLMNELGLTREVIRTMMTELIKEEAVKVANALVCQGHIEMLVNNCFRDIVKGKGYSQSSIRDMVARAAEVEASNFIKSHLRLVALPDEPQ